MGKRNKAERRSSRLRKAPMFSVIIYRRLRLSRNTFGNAPVYENQKRGGYGRLPAGVSGWHHSAVLGIFSHTIADSTVYEFYRQSARDPQACRCDTCKRFVPLPAHPRNGLGDRGFYLAEKPSV